MCCQEDMGYQGHPQNLERKAAVLGLVFLVFNVNNKSRNTPIPRPKGREMGVFHESGRVNEALKSGLLGCVQYHVILYRDISRVCSIGKERVIQFQCLVSQDFSITPNSPNNPGRCDLLHCCSLSGLKPSLHWHLPFVQRALSSAQTSSGWHEWPSRILGPGGS